MDPRGCILTVSFPETSAIARAGSSLKAFRKEPMQTLGDLPAVHATFIAPRCPECETNAGVRLVNMGSDEELTTVWRCATCRATWARESASPDASMRGL